MRLYEMTACEMAEKLASKEIGAVELCEDIFARIDETEEAVASFITLDREGAMAAARAADARRMAGETLHPLAGVPVGIKDNICTDGLRTTCASRMLENFVPPYDATAVSRLKEAGAVIPGKLNMDEFAMGSSCETSYFKKSRNPHDLSRVPGGSSGGSATAVASGQLPLSLGSDTGGSVRLPASYCGIVGLKPTYGAVSRYGLVAFASSLDQIGQFGRTVDDVALLFDAVCGPDRLDATSRSFDKPGRDIEGSVKGMTIGVPAEYFAAGIQPEVEAALRQAIAGLEAEGASVRPISLPSTEYGIAAYYVISSAEASSNLARFDGVRYGYRAKAYANLVDMYERSRSEGFGAEVKRRIMLGTFVLSSGYYDAYYGRAKLMQQRMTAEFKEAFESCDLIVTPTSPTTAFKLGEKIDDPVTMYLNDVCTVCVNIAGLPALSIPCGRDQNGMPVGMQLIGPKFSEKRLFEAAKCHERRMGGALPIPAICGKEGK